MKSCKNCVFALDYELSPACEKCFHHSNWLEKPKTGNPETKSPPMTNADAIRAMSDEELGEAFANFLRNTFKLNKIKAELEDTFEADMIDWLKQPYKENEE